ncbi:hypothetical protein CDL12_16835 [Handroanthus impetiginosus]|uniref:Uncharacterized protein n=1 Tax=Handroanthus impetiginosus TaxID=429701 RepID=A0A2G9GZ62_9LAMI|nr:hypothetical protein CDL12_16835 [Handroanthus impetiginosus]
MENEVTHTPRYNIAMSRRTRRPKNLNIEPQESFEEKEERDKQQKSLKQLIEGRCSLAQHFREEEEQKDMVVHEDAVKGVKLKRIMRNYGKVLGHLIKIKQESYFRAWRKPAMSLKLIKQK